MNLHQQYLTENECYKRQQYITPKGVMVHSTAANNPKLSRYVGPDDGLLGPVSGLNWNQFRPGGQQKCVHAFIGLLKDGTVATYQTLPWNMRGWHAGGKANNTHIGFEICEDGLADGVYFSRVYREAVELTAYLCKAYHLAPLEPGVVICHSEGYRLGVASNHADVLHWFPIHQKTMDDFRRDVADAMENADREEVDEMKYYGTIEDVPEYYRPSIQKLIDRGALRGTDPAGEVLNISEDLCRSFTIQDRLGLLD